ncbi:MBL fold metallo-hydrolase [Phytomonospora endophytica]|uniref:Ribonuclease BN (tRNA processing enzyme) n=1 Tax=Phytomonospora endophytica TaxID=714109 RepID=A0A841FQR5_9ACTN|nr:MBL fold metallo-hydrolase [Phytomonospora endophytica]MBB6038495.1 ribonuclease BN (tRNA processing enzyme) [Phytomonospora endophytica]GIG64425.1 MBL fold metallo-hydrolase [Phytomonospora endophytica]
MRLTVIGCAGSAPAPDSTCSAYLVEESGYRLLLDLGPGSSGPLQKYARPAEIDAAILSHGHSDHHADFTQLWRLRAVDDAPPLPITLPADGPPVLHDNPDSFTPTVAEQGTAAYGPLTVRLARVEHAGLDAFATRVDDALCYTGDTGPCAAIDELADGVGVLLAEASGLDRDGPSKGHLSAGDAARLAVRSGAKLLVLTHLRAWQDHRDLLDEASAIADCPVILAHPGLRVAL